LTKSNLYFIEIKSVLLFLILLFFDKPSLLVIKLSCFRFQEEKVEIESSVGKNLALRPSERQISNRDSRI